jgi:hypothetical protein
VKCFGWSYILETKACKVFWLELRLGDRCVKCFVWSCVFETEVCEVFWLELCLGDRGV